MTNNLKAERTLTAENRVSDERLAQLIANASGAREETWWLDDVADALTELQHLRSQSLSTQQPMGEVRVKALEWSGNVATTRLARYQVDKTAMGWVWVVMAGGGFVSTKYYPTEGGAKAAAQEDYRKRILSALHPNQESGE